MKKLLFGLVALSSLTFAEGLFDFQNAKVVSGTKFRTNVETKGDFDRSNIKDGGTDKTFNVYHEVKGETTLYEFATFDANIKYGYGLSHINKYEENKDMKQKAAPKQDAETTSGTASESSSSTENSGGVTSPVAPGGTNDMSGGSAASPQKSKAIVDKQSGPVLHGDSSIGVALNFKEYGIASVRFGYDETFKLGYRNSFDVDGIKSNLEASYTLKDYVSHIKTKKAGESTTTTPLKHNLDLKLGAEYQVVDNLKAFGHVKLGVDLVKSEYVPGVLVGAEYINIVKSITKLEYDKNFKVSEKVSYDVKEDLTKVKGLLVTPAFEVDTSFISGVSNVNLNLIPSVHANYEIINGLSANADLSTTVKFGHLSNAFTYKGVSPKLDLGLEYKLN